MSDSKKYYYLKLKDNFFESDEIKLLESIENGYLYSNILLKMYLKSLKTEGRLMFRENIPYNAKMLATITGHNIDVVEKAIKLFIEFGLIQILDSGAIYILDLQNYIGESSSEADRIRAYRNKINTEVQVIENKGDVQMYDKCTTNVRQMYDKCTPEREREIEKEKPNSGLLPTLSPKGDDEQTAPVKIEKHKKNDCPYEEIIQLYHSILPSLPTVLTLNDVRKRHIRSRWYNNMPDLKHWETYFKIVAKSSFLMGKISTKDHPPFQCSIDWLIKEMNWIKVQECKYDNRY